MLSQVNKNLKKLFLKSFLLTRNASRPARRPLLVKRKNQIYSIKKPPRCARRFSVMMRHDPPRGEGQGVRRSARCRLDART